MIILSHLHSPQSTSELCETLSTYLPLAPFDHVLIAAPRDPACFFAASGSPGSWFSRSADHALHDHPIPAVSARMGQKVQPSEASIRFLPGLNQESNPSTPQRPMKRDWKVGPRCSSISPDVFSLRCAAMPQQTTVKLRLVVPSRMFSLESSWWQSAASVRTDAPQRWLRNDLGSCNSGLVARRAVVFARREQRLLSPWPKVLQPVVYWSRGQMVEARLAALSQRDGRLYRRHRAPFPP